MRVEIVKYVASVDEWEKMLLFYKKKRKKHQFYYQGGLHFCHGRIRASIQIVLVIIRWQRVMIYFSCALFITCNFSSYSVVLGAKREYFSSFIYYFYSSTFL